MRRGVQAVLPSNSAGQRCAAGRRTAPADQRAHRGGWKSGVRKKGGAPLAALEVKVDTYVLETDVHFPTDLNLLWDAGRKCVDLIMKYRDQFGYALPGWRKAKDWRRKLKTCERATSQVVYRGGLNQEARLKRAVRDYLAVGANSPPKCGTVFRASATSPWNWRTGRHWNTSSACSPNTWIWSNGVC